MANPYFSSSSVFGTDSRARSSAVSTLERPAPDAAELQSMVDGPGAPVGFAAPAQRALTYDDVVMKTGGLLALLVAVAAVTWATPLRDFYLPAAIVGLVLGLVNSFKREPSPVLIIAYTLVEGVFLGGISYIFQNMTVSDSNQSVQPIVMQAVLATMITFGVALALFRSGRVRVTPKFTRWLLISMVGYLAFSLVNVVLSFFISNDGFGPLRSGWMGVVAGLVGVGLAAASLIQDFDSIKRGVENSVPAKFAWSAAFGLMVTLVWLYLEFLRLLSIIAGRR